MRGRFSDLSCKRHFNADFLKLHRNLKQYLINCKRKCTFYWLAFVIPNISYHLSDLESITTSIKKICQKKALHIPFKQPVVLYKGNWCNQTYYASIFRKIRRQYEAYTFISIRPCSNQWAAFRKQTSPFKLHYYKVQGDTTHLNYFRDSEGHWKSLVTSGSC